ncbi:MAG: hypothetical protein II169_08350 [Lachnospiraceae bacterium]|nr:hypothetical protein [Lachnospiraceae bacterium]
MGDKNELKMTVSPVVTRDGKQLAYVSFSDDNRSAEGEIPECIITMNKGFTPEEVACLEDYMRVNRTELKKMAASVNVMNAFMTED